MISQLGYRPFGTSGPFSAPGKISVLAVIASAENRIIVAWDVPPNARDPKGTRSAINVNNYALAAFDPTIQTNEGPVVPPGELVPTIEVGLWRAEVDEEDLTQIHLWTDRNLEPRRRYTLTIDGPIDGDADCDEFIGPIDWTFTAPAEPRLREVNPARVRELVDLHDGGIPTQEIPEIWHYTAGGDVQVQGVIDAFKKRVIRMLTSETGSWIYDPTFGVSIPLKSVARPGEIQRSVNSIRTTLAADPVVAQVLVQCRPERLGAEAVLKYYITVIRRDRQRIELSIPVTVIEG